MPAYKLTPKELDELKAFPTEAEQQAYADAIAVRVMSANGYQVGDEFQSGPGGGRIKGVRAILEAALKGACFQMLEFEVLPGERSSDGTELTARARLVAYDMPAAVAS